jgi:hypothetical protein
MGWTHHRALGVARVTQALTHNRSGLTISIKMGAGFSSHVFRLMGCNAVAGSASSFKVREQAMLNLENRDNGAEAALCLVLKEMPTLEVRRRVELLVSKLTAPPSGKSLQALRAVVILENIDGHEARAVLLKLASVRQGHPWPRQRGERSIGPRPTPHVEYHISHASGALRSRHTGDNLALLLRASV